ncbi:sugar ABC transporter ATP-binding protein [Rhodobacteraceae bacterium LMO-12]|nr:sugar ABC transporter ATP-binding protein [Rhodobacteraceae bacterium LMO-JJ12]
MPNSLISVRGLQKSYGPIAVLNGIDIDFEAGKIHAFLGANGAGKSTFLGCLSGAVAPTKGHIRVGGKDYAAFTPRSALDCGIGIIYQHFQIFDGLTVAENIFVGREKKKLLWIDRKAQEAEAAELLARLRVDIDPSAPVEKLSTGERKIVEIARALNIHPKLLILDEPTAAMGEHEMSALHDVVRHLATSEGIGVVYVTHLLDEINEIADTVTVIRNGSVVWTRPKIDTTTRDLAEAIAPSSTLESATIHRAATDKTPEIELSEFCSPFTGPINLSVAPGEAIGIYGLLGSGRTDLLECLYGARPQTGGTLRLQGKQVSIRTPSQAMAHGVSLVASDRTEQSLFGALSATDNLVMPHFGGKVLPGLVRKPRREAGLFDKIAAKLAVHPANPNLPASSFSGGNAQKIVLGRWLLNDSAAHQVILLDEPTQGVDIGARGQLYEALNVAMSQGASVIFASSDPAEIIALADRVLILGYGRQIALIDKPEDDHELIELAHKTASALHTVH